jgi:hypothetical protein
MHVFIWRVFFVEDMYEIIFLVKISLMLDS